MVLRGHYQSGATVFVQFLATYRHVEGVNNWERDERRVTNDDVMRVTKKYLTPANRIVMTMMPEAKP